MNYLNTGIPIVRYQKTCTQIPYVDKSGMIELLNQKIGINDCYVCVTRPRRFGKTVNANMLGAYYTKGYDTAELFQNRQIAAAPSFADHLNRHNVIYIDFSRRPDLCEDYHTYISSIRECFIEDLTECYPFLKEKKYDSISRMLWDTKESFIFIMDEWDSIFYEEYMSERDKNAYLGFLKNLLKDQPYVDLAYMTGVLPIAKYSSGSELNMFAEYNFINDNIFDRYFGFSESEVKGLCRQFNTVSYEDIRRWYDGYFQSDGSSLFNPRSVSMALTRGGCLNYWTETGPMNEVAECVENNAAEVREDVVKMVSGIPVRVELTGYSALQPSMKTRDEILSAMVVYGFLSYHNGYLQIPNLELMEKFQQVLTRSSMGEIREIVESSRNMLQATLSGDEGKVASFLEEVHDREIPFLEYNDKTHHCRIEKL